MENEIIKYIEDNIDKIEGDMNKRNSTMKYRKGLKGKKKSVSTRKKRQELSVSATKTIKKEDVEIVVKFN